MDSIFKRSTIVMTLSLLVCSIALSQDPSQAEGKRETSIDLSYCKKEEISKTAVAVITAKNNDGKFIPAINVRVNFYTVHNSVEQLLESVNTDNNGKAIIVFNKDLSLDEDNSFTIVARIENDKLLENTEEKVQYKDANLILNLNLATTRLVTAKVTETGKDRKEIPVKGTEVKFYVQRLFGVMPALEDNAIMTDDNGEASFTFPKNIPGDTSGSVTLVAKIENDGQFGSVENKSTVPWGTTLAIVKDPFPRALWEPKAPVPLLITISTLFLGVWFTYFFIFYQLKKIRKEDW